MITNVRAAISAVAGSAIPLNNAAGLGRIFELYVMTGIAERLLRFGWSVQLQRSDGAPFSVGDAFIQRGGKPTGVAPANHGPNGPSSILISNPVTATEWEIWSGVQFRGRSNALHEFDVAIVPRGLAIALRANKTIGFPFGRPVVAIECKDVQSAGSPDEMRTLVARLYDVTLTRSHTYLTGGASVSAIYPVGASHPGFLQAERTYRDSNLSTKSALARTGGFSSGAIAMTSYYSISPYDQVIPGTATSAQFFDDVSSWIDKYL
jgi:hypothetical protein